MNLEPFTFVLERLGNLLIDEIKLLSTDKKRLLGNLQLQLELGQSFVRDVEEEKQQATISHVLKTEVQHIMQILPQIEDYLDTIHLKAQKSQLESSPFHKFKVCFSCTSNPLVCTHIGIDTALQLIKDLEDARQRAIPYQQLSTRPQFTPRRRPKTQPHIMNDDFIVGLEEEAEILLAKLTGKEDEHTTILAIAGMGGSGKTTLARKIYNHQHIKRQFTVRAWVCISQEWDTSRGLDTSQILREICKQVGIQPPQDRSLVPDVELLELLLSSSCLVVIDDVWKREALQELTPLLLPAGISKGNGRVVVTTRNEDILNYPALAGVYIHKARCLTPAESWDLFSKIVRNKWQSIKSCGSETVFAKLGKEMLARCHGLPLAIVALAGLLSTKSSMQEWESLKNNVSSAIMRQNKGFHDYGSVKHMLELSYSDLPYDIKPCFLYMGVFSENSDIRAEFLIQLWIGEGILRPNLCYEGQTLEELGTDFVNELVQRFMVQVIRRDYEEKVVVVQLHDLFRDLCVDKARELGFFEIVSPSTLPMNSMESMSRRAIIPRGWDSHPISSSRLRSILKIFNPSAKSVKLDMAHESMKFLRVLDIGRVDLQNFEVQIGNLILLRYLRISYCNGAMNLVLLSVKKLRNLLTFKFYSNDESVMVPNDMVGSMVHLRCLHMSLRLQFGGPILGLGRSKSLQSLHSPPGEWLCNDLQVVSLVHTLQRLVLTRIVSKRQLDAVSDFVGTPSNHLQILDLLFEDGSGLEFDLRRMKLECCSQLKSLRLQGRIRKQEGPFFFPPNLLNLRLYYSQIEKGEDFETALAQLHQLRCIEIGNGSYEGDKLTLTGLSQLQELVLKELDNLKECRIEQGALCQLKHLEIRRCLKLERISEGVSGIHTLRSFKALVMSSSFCERLQRPLEKEGSSRAGGGGEDFHLIRHIPHIQIEDEKHHRYDV